MIDAKVVLDSVSPFGDRLTTMEVRMHRFVLAEFNTHRVFSRNSASSRAIPVAKQIERVVTDPAMPVSWPAEQKGMQGGAEIEGNMLAQIQSNWALASRQAAEAAGVLSGNGLHKSLTNRLLEPFMWHTVIVTATAWENFFALRLDADAQPEIRVAAEALKAVYDASTPMPRGNLDWHLPYVMTDPHACEDIWSRVDGVDEVAFNRLAVRVSTARCARVSYLTHDGVRDIDADLTLYDRLITDRVTQGKPVHWSPAEHVATPWAANRQVHDPNFGFTDFEGKDHGVAVQHQPRTGNLLGWRSLRTTIETIQRERTYR